MHFWNSQPLLAAGISFVRCMVGLKAWSFFSHFFAFHPFCALYVGLLLYTLSSARRVCTAAIGYASETPILRFLLLESTLPSGARGK